MSRNFDLERTPYRQVLSDNLEYALQQRTTPQIVHHVQALPTVTGAARTD